MSEETVIEFVRFCRNFSSANQMCLVMWLSLKKYGFLNTHLTIFLQQQTIILVSVAFLKHFRSKVSILGSWAFPNYIGNYNIYTYKNCFKNCLKNYMHAQD